MKTIPTGCYGLLGIQLFEQMRKIKVLFTQNCDFEKKNQPKTFCIK